MWAYYFYFYLQEHSESVTLVLNYRNKIKGVKNVVYLGV